MFIEKNIHPLILFFGLIWYEKSIIKLLVPRGFTRTYFDDSDDAIKQAILKERIEPYLDDDVYKV